MLKHLGVENHTRAPFSSARRKHVFPLEGPPQILDHHLFPSWYFLPIWTHEQVLKLTGNYHTFPIPTQESRARVSGMLPSCRNSSVGTTKFHKISPQVLHDVKMRIPLRKVTPWPKACIGSARQAPPDENRSTRPKCPGRHAMQWRWFGSP